MATLIAQHTTLTPLIAENPLKLVALNSPRLFTVMISRILTLASGIAFHFKTAFLFTKHDIKVALVPIVRTNA